MTKLEQRAMQVVGSKATKRFWRRRDRRAGWSIGGWLPIVGLLALFAYGAIQTAPAMQAQIAEEVRAALTTNGVEGSSVEADGQAVFVRARGAPGDAARIKALAATAACDTWIGGRLVCPTSVRVEIVESSAESIAVPAVSTQAAIDVPGGEEALERGVSATRVEAGLPSESTPAEAAGPSRCEARLAAALADSTIEFRTGSAEISSQSLGLIDSLAVVARECAVPLIVEGHTDTSGSADSNLALSLARAQAVAAALAAAGVDASALSARGFGADRPIADNATATGRARNRRIEIHVNRDAAESNQ